MDIQKIIVTNVNYGYIPLLMNLRHSLEKVELLKFLRIFSVGKKCKNKLDTLGVENYFIDDESVENAPVPWNTSKWKKVSYQKIKVLNLALAQFGSFLYTDPDIIYQKDVFPFLESLPGEFDIYGQDDYPNHPICSGFMYVQDNKNTRKIFSIPWEEYDKITNKGDQVYINTMADTLKFYSLPRKLFLNGIWFAPYQNQFIPDKNIMENAYIFHYNCTSCLQNKYDRMRKNGHLRAKVGLLNSTLGRKLYWACSRAKHITRRAFGICLSWIMRRP